MADRRLSDFDTVPASEQFRDWDRFGEADRFLRVGDERHRYRPYRADIELGSPGGFGFEPRADGRGPRRLRRSDESILHDVCEGLTDDPRVDASEIVVDVQDGEVTLQGNVSDRRQKRIAGDIANAVSGVVDVHVRLRLA